MDQELQTEYEYNNWGAGIADSPELGFGDMRNCNIERYPNVITPNFATIRTNAASLTTTFVRSGSSNFIVLTATGSVYTGMAVTLTTTGSLPTGLITNKTYFVGNISGSSVTLSDTVTGALAGTPVVTLTGNGTGVQTLTATDMGTIQDFAILYPVGSVTAPVVFCIDGNGRVWYQSSSGSGITGLTQGPWYLIPKSNDGLNNMGSQGITLFTGSDNKVWLFASTNTSLDVIDTSLIGDASNWTVGFKTFATGYFHKGLTGQDNIVYFTDGYYITSLQENVGSNFTPSTAGTYTFAAKALTLPKYETAQCLEELGVNLLIGGRNSNYIYPWDRTSVTFDLPLRVGEKNTVRMINISNVVYILAGVKGIIYYTTGYSVIPVKKIPEYLTGGSVQWGGVAKLDGNLLFGFVGTQGDNDGNINGGVGKLFITEQASQSGVIPTGTLTIDQTVASGSTSANVTALIGYQNTDVSTPSPFSTYYLGSSTGVDVVDLSNVRSDGSAYVVCNLEHVSPISSSRNFEEIGVELNQALGTGQGVNIQYRAAMKGAFSALQNFSYANYGAVTNAFDNGNISDANVIQLKVILTSDGGRNPLLQSVTIK